MLLSGLSLPLLVILSSTIAQAQVGQPQRLRRVFEKDDVAEYNPLSTKDLDDEAWHSLVTDFEGRAGSYPLTAIPSAGISSSPPVSPTVMVPTTSTSFPTSVENTMLPTPTGGRATIQPSVGIVSDVPSGFTVSDVPSLVPSDDSSTVSPGSAVPTTTCNMSASLRSLLIRVIVNSISESSEVDTDASPQNRAFAWLIEQDGDNLYPDDVNLVQRYTLAVFYYSTLGDRWSECAAPTDVTSETAIEAANDACTLEPVEGSGSNAWLTPGSECLWGGVVCDENGSVDRIDFGTSKGCLTVEHNVASSTQCISHTHYSFTETNGLSGTIASELRELSTLRYLLLEDGVISGTIPRDLGLIQSLEIIDLNFNLIGGPIPEELYNLENLQQLDLNDNLLEGTISESIGKLQALTFFQVQNNRLTGTIPSSLGTLPSLGKCILFC